LLAILEFKKKILLSEKKFLHCTNEFVVAAVELDLKIMINSSNFMRNDSEYGSLKSMRMGFT